MILIPISEVGILYSDYNFFLAFQTDITEYSVSISGRGLLSKTPSEAREHMDPNRLSWANREIQKESALISVL